VAAAAAASSGTATSASTISTVALAALERITPNGTLFQPAWHVGDDLLAFCKAQPYSRYVYVGPNGSMANWIGEKPLKRAPKVEFYLTDDGECCVADAHGTLRAIYRWGQRDDFVQAGYPMPPFLRAIAARIEAEFGERVNHCIIINYAHGTEQHAPPHKDKAEGVEVKKGVPRDMERDASFFVLSVGYPRKFTLQRTKEQTRSKLADTDVVFERALPSGSLLKVSAKDNRELYHAVHKQAGAGVRYSIIFRTIKSFAPVDAAVANEVNGEAHRFIPASKPEKRKTAGPRLSRKKQRT